jgi:predicted permease
LAIGNRQLAIENTVMETLFKDIRCGIRGLLKHPGFTATAVITLALGIGVNTAIFSVVNAVLLKPVPYLNPPRLVVIESGNKQADSREFYGASPADFWDWQAQSKTFEQIAAYSPDGGLEFTGVEKPEFLAGARVSTNFFQTFGAQPMLGRTFSLEDEAANAPDTIVLSYRLWQRRFGGDQKIIGRTLGNTGVTVIGVMPVDFKYPSYAECWIPLSRNSSEMRTRANRYFITIGLIGTGQSLGSAQAELKTIANRLEAQYPESNKNITVQLTQLHDRQVRDIKKSLLILLGAVGFVLLVACANIANLLLARAAARRREMVIHLALGASSWQLLRQLLTESVLLAMLGGALGLLLGLWGMSGLMRLLPNSYDYLQLKEQVGIDRAVLFFTVLISLLTGIIFGLVPAWQASRLAMNGGLKESSHASDGSPHRRLREALVVAEIALAMVLLVGAGLLINSFVRMRQVSLGFDSRNLLSISIGMPFNKFPDDASRVRFVKQIVDQAAHAPNVESAMVTSGAIFPFLHFNFNIVSRPLPADADALYETISPHYFRNLRAQVLAGREFEDHDDAHTPPVAIVNQTLARRYFAGEDPLGKRLSIIYLRKRVEFEVVGVVADLKQGELSAPVIPQIYVPYLQRPWLSSALVVRAGASNLSAVQNDVQRAIWNVDPNQVPARIETAEQVLSTSLAEPRLYTSLLGIFAALALGLAAVGIYGVMSYAVTQRTHEIGIRMALGARGADVLKLVVKSGMTLALIGMAIGVVSAFALTRLMISLLFGVTPTDVTTFAMVCASLMAVALIACYIPARRATKVDPLVALRYE